MAVPVIGLSDRFLALKNAISDERGRWLLGPHPEAHTEHRIRQTAAMVFPVMMRGGLMSPGGTGVAQVLKVRLIHATIRHLVLRGTPPDSIPALPPRAPAGWWRIMHDTIS